MKKNVEIKRKRIIIYYALAIVLPCLILGILALRGIKNDQALVEREQRRNLTETGQQIIRETDDYLSSIEKSFTEIVASSDNPRKIIFTDPLLGRFCFQHQSVEGIFFRSLTGDLFLLNQGLLYVPDDYVNVPDMPGFKNIQDILDKGWQYEFRENNYSKAVQYYQSVLQNISDKQAEGEILNIVARLQKNLKLEDEAIKTYERISVNYTQVLLQNKLPLGAVALLEKSLLYLIKMDTASALETVYRLSYQMLKGGWELGYTTFASFRSKADEIILACKNSNDEGTRHILKKISSLNDSLSISENHTGHLLAFIGNSEALPAATRQDSVNNNRFKTMIDGESYFYSLMPANSDGQWGLIMDPEYLLRTIVYHSIIKNTEGSDFSWKVTNIDGDLLLKSESIPGNVPVVLTVFPSNLPSWTLSLFPADTGLFGSLLGPGKSLFLYIFIAIVIILAFGLFFTLQTVNNELRLTKMKSYFISTVSHEFKSPLTSIRQMAEMLVHDRVPSPERQRKYYTSILKQSERLSHLINNILDFSKMEEGRRLFLFEKADIVPVVRDIVETFRQYTADQGFLIDLIIPETLPDVVFDREAMEQVIHNLLDNACKYSGDSRNIEVHLSSKGNKILISVIDHGIGIKKEDLDKIFGRFYRAGEELTQTVKGSGIGLTIVKQIVEAHHGEISVESEVGKGSTFTVRVPLIAA